MIIKSGQSLSNQEAQMKPKVKIDNKTKKHLKQVVDEALTPLEALKKILAHVEDMDAVRVGNQCTLCFSYRMLGHAAVAKAEGKGLLK